MTLEEVLKKDKKLVYTNVGISMMPLLRQGKDLLCVEETDVPYKMFDAVLFKRPEIKGRGEYILHRIMKVNKNGTYFIIGDNCYTGETVLKENILGILTKIQRNGKDISCDNFFYLLYVRIWWLLYPLRLVLYIMKRVLLKILGR